MIDNTNPFFQIFATAWRTHDYEGLNDIFEHIVLEDGDYFVAKMAAENITHYTPSPCHALVLSKMPAGLKKDAFIMAARMWGAEDVYLWLEHIDPNDYILGLSAAAEAGITDSVELLIPLTDCTQMESEALRWAAQENNLDCVRTLLPHSNPTDCRSEALHWACYHQNPQMADLLIPVSDCTVVRNQFTAHPQSGKKEDTRGLEFLDSRINLLQRNRLVKHLDEDGTGVRLKKKI